MNIWTMEHVQKLGYGSNLYSMLENLNSHIHHLGFDYYAFTFISPAVCFSHDSYPEQWNKHYQCCGYASIDPVLIHCRQSPLPLLWSAQAFSQAPQLWADAQAHGLCYGWSQPHCGDPEQYSCLTLLRRSGPVSNEELYEKSATVLWLGKQLHWAVPTETR